MKRIILLGIIIYMCLPLFAQVDSAAVSFTPKYRRGVMYEVKTTQNTVRGFLIEEKAETIVIEDRKNDQIYELRKSTIISMKQVGDSDAYKRDFLDQNYHAHTYLFSGSSLINEDAETYVNYQWMLLENINYAIDKNWSITVNTLFLYPTSVGVKCAYEIGTETYVGGNAFVIGNLSDRVMPSSLFLGYGALGRITRGNSNKNFSFSGGIIGVNTDAFRTANRAYILNTPFANFSYCNRFHAKWALCAEGWYFPKGQIGLGGAGFKFLKSRETSWTFGCFTYMDIMNNQLVPNFKAVPIPYLGFTSNLTR